MMPFPRSISALPISVLALLVGAGLWGPPAVQAQEPTAVTSMVNSEQDTTLEVNHNGSLLMPGTFDPAARNDSIPAEGAGTRLLWYPAKAAFRAGQVTASDWDASNIGVHSVAFGQDTEAPGAGSAALGTFTSASGNVATAMGSSTTAATSQSLSIGECNSANTSSDNTLFVAGNGVFDLLAGSCSRSDAMVLKKNGRLTTAGSVESESGGFVLPDGTILDEGSDLGQLSLPFSGSESSSGPILELDNTGSGDAFHVGMAGDDGFEVRSAGGAGFQARAVANHGVFVGEVGSPSTVPSEPAVSSAFEVKASEGNGLTVGRADVYGIDVRSAGAGGVIIENTSIGTDIGNANIGVNVHDVVNGLEIDNTSATGVSVTGAGGYAAYLSVSQSQGAASPNGHAVLVENLGGTNADGLAIASGPDTDPGSDTNFVTFYDGNRDPVGTVEGNGSGGVSYETSGKDFAEDVPVAESSPTPEPKDLVGVVGGTVSLETDGTDRLMVVSSVPAMTGNARPSAEDRDRAHVPVAFIGQVPVQLRGTATEGDVIVASGKNDGTARAVAPSDYLQSEHGPVAGQVWSAKTSEGVGTVTVAVGLGAGSTLAMQLGQERRRNDRQEQQITRLQKRLTALENRPSSVPGAGGHARGAGLPGSWLWGGALLLFLLGGSFATLLQRSWQ